MENTCEHPIVFLKDIKISEVRAILDYMYKGEVNVAQEELPGKFFSFEIPPPFLKREFCQSLKVSNYNCFD